MTLSDVCVSVAYIGPKLRTDTTFKVRSQGHQAALLTAAFTHQAAAAVVMGMHLPWEPTATLRLALQLEALRCPQREENVGAYCSGFRTVCSLLRTSEMNVDALHI